MLGFDCFSLDYSVSLKRNRAALLAGFPRFRMVEADFAKDDAYASTHEQFRPDYVIHLGAQAGVRRSIQDPESCVWSNILGFTKVLEAVRRHPPRHFLYASSSSVYGANSASPYREDAAADQPVSFYGATKRANELMAHSHSHVHGLASTGLRFFTVYGSWGRPDMAPMLFSEAICSGRSIRLFNRGRNVRDFTHVSDIVRGICALMHIPSGDSGGCLARVVNLGRNSPVLTLDFVAVLERALGRRASIELVDSEPGDMQSTCADISLAQDLCGYAPSVSLEDGIAEFADWFSAWRQSVA